MKVNLLKTCAETYHAKMPATAPAQIIPKPMMHDSTAWITIQQQIPASFEVALHHMACSPATRPNGAALMGATPLPSTAERPSRHSVETATAATCSRWKPFMACKMQPDINFTAAYCGAVAPLGCLAGHPAAQALVLPAALVPPEHPSTASRKAEIMYRGLDEHYSPTIQTGGNYLMGRGLREVKDR